MSTHTCEFDHDREQAAICMRASQLISRRGVTSSIDEHTALAMGQLLNTVSLALTADGHSVPISVRRAALRVADSLVNAELWSAPKTGQARDIPFTASIRLGRMG
jgi:hypothetical protein